MRGLLRWYGGVDVEFVRGELEWLRAAIREAPQADDARLVAAMEEVLTIKAGDVE